VSCTARPTEKPQDANLVSAQAASGACRMAAAAVALLVVIYFLAVIGYQMVTAPLRLSLHRNKT